ncbi:hypothetical protein L9Z73_28725 [Pseudomonas sp. TNT11]|uniref:Uncharacterized protein n=1 Tax=Pseudomonas emilianonis TaxID=2915812 RepID=A0ABT0ER10_9PSED|nr:hypothetical protein [Pseudomonas emilianonis]MCK1788160.1 hypothetical protein [Pseudomonas emilianonis]
MSDPKWAAYDVARSRLLIQICDVNNALHLEEAKATPDTAKIVALENELDALNDQSDMLSADDIELTSKIASGPCP